MQLVPRIPFFEVTGRGGDGPAVVAVVEGGIPNSATENHIVPETSVL
jgi:hypothetical protein